MSLIQEALEKAGQSSSESILTAESKPKASPKPKPFQNQSKQPIQLVPAAVAPKVETLTSQPPRLTKKRDPKKTQSPKVFVAIFGIAVLLIAAGACFILGAQITESWGVSSPTPAIEKANLSESAINASAVRIEREQQFHLSGITSSGNGELLALINNQVLSVGDSLRDGVTVQEISARKVILQAQNREVILSF